MKISTRISAILDVTIFSPHPVNFDYTTVLKYLQKRPNLKLSLI
ncbi:hypothetical protein CDSM653_01817 [Caldanaerobacter subterraneus subsp. pacificus DSM 12653]|uniref:Uncharacterized protein n=1 Tax=Caldanaerobacter subterraneus subsp. pacificus DSM 12653 TaxID=391606 RepID=A0A0F5PLD0_9THEO|nr:hypothetical protein CDSM653_01817 [Caldanaerobacter subterraneus subsp. pacificus DSM 12653]